MACAKIELAGRCGILIDVKRVARQRVAAQRVLFVDLKSRQLFKLGLPSLNLRLQRKRSRHGPARLERAQDGER